jgi:hypothetical protein
MALAVEGVCGHTYLCLSGLPLRQEVAVSLLLLLLL